MKKMFVIAVIALASIISVSAKENIDRDWANFNRYKEANTQVTKTPVAVLMGDSVTQGWFEKHGEFFADGTFLGRGISGQVTSQMLIRFRRDVVDFHPKYAVILAGINDIARNQGYIAKENIYGNIVSMCEIAKANKIKPVICSILPSTLIGWRKEIGNPAADIIWINEQLKAYAKANHCIYVDYFNAMVEPDGDMPETLSKDRVHPTLEGYLIMEDVLLKALKIKK